MHGLPEWIPGIAPCKVADGHIALVVRPWVVNIGAAPAGRRHADKGPDDGKIVTKAFAGHGNLHGDEKADIPSMIHHHGNLVAQRINHHIGD